MAVVGGSPSTAIVFLACLVVQIGFGGYGIGASASLRTGNRRAIFFGAGGWEGQTDTTLCCLHAPTLVSVALSPVYTTAAHFTAIGSFAVCSCAQC